MAFAAARYCIVREADGSVSWYLPRAGERDPQGTYDHATSRAAAILICEAANARRVAEQEKAGELFGEESA